MKPLSLEEIRREMRGTWRSRGADVMPCGVSIDSRTARPGELFIAIRGQKLDGHAYLPQAARAGCIAAVVAQDASLPEEVLRQFGAGVIAVDDTIAALGGLATYYRRQIGATVIAVTGSNGKTTVKEMIRHILSRRLKGSCSPKSFNNNIGVPLTLLAVEGGHDYVVCEIGTNAPGEVAALAEMVRPSVAVITSVSATHLEKLGTVEKVAVEKAALLGALAEDGLAVVWADSDALARAVQAHARRVIRFGTSDGADLRLTACQARDRGQRFQVNGRLWVKLPVPGRHNAMNALAAMAVAQRLGFGEEEAMVALADFEGAPQRLEWIDAPSLTILNDSYNSNPASLLAAADVLSEAPAERRVVIAGDMAELGPESAALHVRTGREIAARNVDLLIGIGAMGRYIARGAAEAGLKTATFSTVMMARRLMGGLLRPGDVVLVKGSRVMAMERLIDPLTGLFVSRRKKNGRAKGSQR